MAGSVVGGGESLITMGLLRLPSSISSWVRFVGDDGGVRWMGDPKRGGGVVSSTTICFPISSNLSSRTSLKVR